MAHQPILQVLIHNEFFQESDGHIKRSASFIMLTALQEFFTILENYVPSCNAGPRHSSQQSNLCVTQQLPPSQRPHQQATGLWPGLLAQSCLGVNILPFSPSLMLLRHRVVISFKCVLIKMKQSGPLIVVVKQTYVR